MNSPKYLSWDNFRSSILVPGQERVHRVSTSPFIEIFSDGATRRIGIWLQTPAGTKVPPELSKLAFLTAHTLTRDGRDLLELATASIFLQRQFYHFATAVSERVLVERQPAIEAVTLELQCFTELIESRSLLGLERQLGLLGELIFLERLLFKNGGEALDAWIGPQGEPHDFRVGSREYEIKTTTSARRIHTINGAEQLVPSAGCSLALISVQLGPGGDGAGASLAEKVESVSILLAPTPVRMTQFTAALELCGLLRSELPHYTRRFTPRRPLAVVPVDGSFPAITRPVIQGALGIRAVRIEALQYDVNVEGLEHEEGSDLFGATTPL